MEKVSSVVDRRRIVEETLIPHTAFQEAATRLEQAFLLADGRSPPLNQLILGESRTGKTTLLDEVRMKHRPFRTEEGRTVPILSVSAQSMPSAKSLAEAMLSELGDPRFESGTENAKTIRLRTLMRETGVRMLMIDEFQHFYDKTSHKVQHHVADWLKLLGDNTKVALVVAGLPSCRAVLDQNSQLAGRFHAPLLMRRFDWKSDDDREEFVGILTAFHQALSNHFDIPALGSAEMSFRCYCGTGGLIGYLTTMLRKAVLDAEDENRTVITIKDLAKAHRAAVWNKERLSDVSNPFARGFVPLPSDALLAQVANLGVDKPEAAAIRQRSRSAGSSDSVNQILSARC